MFIPPSPIAPESRPDKQVQDAQYYRGVLHDLIDIGVDLARLVQQQARSQAGAANTVDAGTVMSRVPVQDFAVAFDRIARAVRRNIVLARRLDEPVLPAIGRGKSPGEADRPAARRRIIREVEDNIQRSQGRGDPERLQAELLERLDSPELDDDLGHLPVEMIIENICRDLGIAHWDGTHPWKRRTPADVAELCARATMIPATMIPATTVQATTVWAAGVADGVSGDADAAGYRGSG